eukprot:2969011-Amphidinium_carterae.1
MHKDAPAMSTGLGPIHHELVEFANGELDQALAMLVMIWLLTTGVLVSTICAMSSRTGTSGSAQHMSLMNRTLTPVSARRCAGAFHIFITVCMLGWKFEWKRTCESKSMIELAGIAAGILLTFAFLTHLPVLNCLQRSALEVAVTAESSLVKRCRPQ